MSDAFAGAVAERERLWSLAHRKAPASRVVEAYEAALAAGNAGVEADFAHVLWRHLRRPRDAESILRRLLRTAPSVEVHRELGALLAKENSSEAVGHLERAVEMGSGWAAETLGQFLNRQGEAFAAEEAYRRAIALGRRTVALNNLALMFEGQPGRIDEAAELYRLAIDDGNNGARYNLGRLLAKQPGRADEAEQLLREALANGQEEARNALAQLIFDTGGPDRWAEAEELFDQAAANGDFKAINNLAILRHREGRVDDAVALWALAAEANGGSSWSNYGLALALLGRLDEAENAFKRALECGVHNVAADLARILRKQPGREAEAERWVAAAIAEGDRRIHVFLGDDDRKARDLDTAEAEFRKAADLGVPRARNALAKVLSEQPARRQEARAVALAAIHEGDQSAHATLGWMLAQDGELDQAASHARALIAQQDPWGDVLLSFVISRSSDIEQQAAISELRQKMNEGDRAALHALSHCIHRVGDRQESLDIHQQWLGKCPAPPK